MKQQKKNRFFTFIFSFLPGAAEMYMGFMKNGISLMGLFFVSIIVPSMLRISDVFILLGVLVWFFGFFHAGNLAGLSDERFEATQDVYIWEEFLGGKKVNIASASLQKWTAVVLIVCGLVILWQNFSSIIYSLMPDYLWNILVPVLDRIPQVAISLLIIGIGVHMIMGKKVETDGEGKES